MYDYIIHVCILIYCFHLFRIGVSKVIIGMTRIETIILGTGMSHSNPPKKTTRKPTATATLAGFNLIQSYWWGAIQQKNLCTPFFYLFKASRIKAT